MIPDFMNALLPIVATTATIALSALTGAIAILSGQWIRERRRLYSAIHTELVDNYIDVGNAIVRVEDDGQKVAAALPNRGLSTSAFEAVRQRDALFWSQLDASVEMIQVAYSNVYAANIRTGSSDSVLSIRVEAGDGVDKQQSSTSEGPEQDRLDNLKIVEDTIESAIEGLEGYAREGRLRRTLYYRCEGQMPESLLTDSDGETDGEGNGSE